MEITKCITISTQNITPEANANLYRIAEGNSANYCTADNEVTDMFTVYAKETYGYFMYVNEDYDQSETIKHKVNKCIRELYDFAVQKGAGLIIIDCDASKAEGLTDHTKEWEEYWSRCQPK